MPKPMFVWSGSAWVSVATEVESLAGFATQSYADNTPGMRLIVPSSVTVGSGSGSVSTSGAVTFSGASTVSPNGCFTSAYENYRIVFNGITSTNADLYFRLRAAASDQSGANYAQNSSLITTALTVSRASGQTSLRLTQNNSGTYEYVLTADIFAPQLSSKTIVKGDGTQFFSNFLFGGSYEANYQADGFTMFPNTGTMTGNLRIYGMKN